MCACAEMASQLVNELAAQMGILGALFFLLGMLFTLGLGGGWYLIRQLSAKICINK